MVLQSGMHGLRPPPPPHVPLDPQQSAGEDVQVALIGNKCDLVSARVGAWTVTVGCGPHTQ